MNDSIWFIRALYPPHKQGVAQEEQDHLRDSDRGEGRQVRQPGDHGKNNPDTRSGVKSVQQRGEVGPERPANPPGHEPAQDTARYVHERHEGELELARERAEEVDDHGPHPEGRDGRRVLYDQGLERLPDPELQRSEGDGRDREAQDDVERPDHPGDGDPAGRAPLERGHLSPYCTSAQPSLRGSLPHARTPLSSRQMSWAPPVGTT